MNEPQRINVDLRNCKKLSCNDCGCPYFRQIIVLYEVPKLITGKLEDTLLTIPANQCINCGNIYETIDNLKRKEPSANPQKYLKDEND